MGSSQSSSGRPTVSAKIEPEQIEFLEEFKEAHNQDSRSEAIRTIFADRQREFEAQTLSTREILTLSPVRGLLGLLFLFMWSLGILLSFAILLLGFIDGSLTIRLLVRGFAIASMATILFAVPGLTLWFKAQFASADRKKIKQVREPTTTETAEVKS